MVKSQAQFKRVNVILKKLLITHFIHIPILELKICKHFPLRQNVRGIQIKLNQLALVVFLNNDVSNSPKKFFTLCLLCRSQQLLLICPDSVSYLYKLPVEVYGFPFLDLVVYYNQLGVELIIMSNQVIELFVFSNLLLSSIA